MSENIATMLETEMNEDGEQQITQTTQASNYEMEIKRAVGELPDAPPLVDLSKLFKPKYILNVKTPDGSVIPFTYKRLDPGTLMATHGEPLTLDTAVRQSAQELISRLEELQSKPRKKDEPITPDEAAELQEITTHPDYLATVKKGMQLRKVTVQTGVISPQITDELYEELDDEILDMLSEAISGGVTNQNELVQHFPEHT